jgi:signal transduction histidine kinase/ActR/RegA family two-component response regulator
MDYNEAGLGFLSGGGNAARQIAETDWTGHGMGPVSAWPSAFRTALSMVLNSGFPSYVIWGPEFFVFYNDAYVPILGNKQAIGQGWRLADLWAEVGDEAVDIARTAYRGSTTFAKDRAFTLERYGQPQLAYFTFSLSPIRDDGGAVIGALCIIAETTESVVSTAKLRQSEDRLQLSLDASGNIGTWSWYPGTNATYVDERFARLFQVDAALAQSGTALERFTNMIHPDDRARVLDAISNSITTGELYEADYRIPQLSGKDIWVTAKGRLFDDEQGGAKRFAGVAVDITERRKKEDERARLAKDLQAAHRRQSEFLATLAHELRNPLAPIRSALDLMRIGQPDSQATDRLRGMMERQVSQLAHLIDDLMDLARINNGKVELRLEPQDVGDAIRAAIETSMPHIDRARQQLSTAIPVEALVVQGDRLRLAQVFGNILANAAKYTPAGGQIGIAAWRDGDQAVIEIKDNGMGIPAESLSDVFEMFSQVRTDIAQGGLGIGLSLVKRIVELHHGTVAAASGGIGQGASFYVRLPLTAVAADAIDTAEEVSSVTPGAASYRILVADDNVDAAETLGSVLTFHGHQVGIAADGEQAIAVAQQLVPDFAFLDIGMPGKDGHAVAKEIRASATLKHTVLVAVTGWGTAADRALSKEAGFDYHLTKPVSITDIAKILQKELIG